MNKQDEEKAIEIVDETHLYEEGTKYLHTDRVMCETLLEMAAWKERQMIEWLEFNIGRYLVDMGLCRYGDKSVSIIREKLIEDFKNYMEEN